MGKSYETHEIAYKRLKHKRAKSWHEMYSTTVGQEPDHPGKARPRFPEDIFEKITFSVKAPVLEIGCGTGPLIRWITSEGFSGTGIDISTTAIEIAREQTTDSGINFIQGDYCYTSAFNNSKFDLIVDGSCFHCIVEDSDRKLFLKKSYELLNENGVFVLFSSCSPINKKSFAEKYKSEIFEKGIFYVPYNVELEGSKNFNGKLYMAQRNFEHWKNILKIDKEKDEVATVLVKGKDGMNMKYALTNFEKNVELSDATFVFDRAKHPDVECYDE